MTELELWEVLVPTVRNDGKPYRTRHHRVWDSRIRKLTGGLTVMPVAKGQWVSPDGVLFRERMIPVRIACKPAHMAEIIAVTMQHYPDQIAVMAHRVSDKVLIVHRDRPN